MTATFNKHRLRNFFIGVSVACSLTLYAFNYKVEVNPDHINGPLIYDGMNEGVIAVSHTEPPPPQPEKKKVIKRQLLQFDFGEVKTVSDDVKIKPLVKEIPKPSPITMTMVPPTPSQPSGPFGIEGVVTGVDERPEFPGGPDALRKYLRNNINYPSELLENEGGRIRVFFVVDEEGNITDSRILRNELPKSAGDEAKRVIANMPRWKPAVKNGKNVKTYFIQPLIFRVF